MLLLFLLRVNVFTVQQIQLNPAARVAEIQAQAVSH